MLQKQFYDPFRSLFFQKILPQFYVALLRLSFQVENVYIFEKVKS